MNNLEFLLRGALGDRAQVLLYGTQVHEQLLTEQGLRVSRGVLAQALNMLLFADLIDRVPEAADYFAESLAAGRPLLLDHGALRTIGGVQTGQLPAGIEAIARVLKPLGFRHAGDYPLRRLNMHGAAFCHVDMPEDISQFFVSELYPQAFSESFQRVVADIASTAADPLDDEAKTLLAKLDCDAELMLDEAGRLLPALVLSFARQHRLPTRAEYEALLAESAEMAWIATEGNAFNHATDRVDDLEATMDAQRAAGRRAKDRIEVSGSGRVRQSALKAAVVSRDMMGFDGSIETFEVPGSFFEFIARDRYRDTDGTERLDLRFDSSNAQGIFKMTSVRKSA